MATAIRSLGEVWRPLRDAILNFNLEFSIKLEMLQIAYKNLGIEVLDEPRKDNQA